MIDTSITPNFLSFIGLVIGLLTAALFSLGVYLYSLIAIVFYNLYFIIDCLDGELARARGTTSQFGQALDNFSDRFVEGFIFVGLSIGVYNALEKPVFLIFGLLTVIHYFLFSFTSEVAYSGDTPNVPKINLGKTMYFSSHSIIIAVVTLAAVFNLAWLLIEVVALVGWIFWVIQFYRIYIYERKI